jgi:hypothetical protein
MSLRRLAGKGKAGTAKGAAGGRRMSRSSTDELKLNFTAVVHDRLRKPQRRDPTSKFSIKRHRAAQHTLLNLLGNKDVTA